MKKKNTKFIYFIKKITKIFFCAYKNRFSGVRNPREFLKIKVVNLKKLKNINTSSTIIGLKFI